MSSVSGFQGIINEIKADFVIAKFDGKLEAAEVVQIATNAAMKIHSFSSGSLDEKKALVVLALKQGLAAANGLHGLADSSPSGIAAAEKQVLDGALAAVNTLMGVAPHLFAPAQGVLSSLKESLLKCLPFCSQAAAIAKALDPKDTLLISQAMEMVKGFPIDVTSILESVTATPAQVNLCEDVDSLPDQDLEVVLDKNTAEKAPNPVASPPDVPVSVPGASE